MFKVAGVSTRNGQTKVRFANDMTRIKVLVKTGHTDINLIELPEAMDKPAVVSYLKTTELYANPALREAIDNADAKYNGSGPVVDDEDKPAKATKPAKAVKVKPDMDRLRARAAEAQAEVTEPAAEVKKSVEAETV
jgi:hypothetical protein